MNLYGLTNHLISELRIKLIMDNDFNKLVYYKDDDSDIFSLPELENPFEQLNNQVFKNRRPKKVLDKQDVLVFIYLKRIKRDGYKTNKANTIWINVGLLVHENCSNTLNGEREYSIISAIEKIAETSDFQSALGKCSYEGSELLNGIPFEWNGYVSTLRFDGFTERCLK